VIVIRYADDSIVGFQHGHEAKAFLHDLQERMREFELALHPAKTRLPRFGRQDNLLALPAALGTSAVPLPPALTRRKMRRSHLSLLRSYVRAKPRAIRNKTQSKPGGEVAALGLRSEPLHHSQRGIPVAAS
jgi:hypothetical protein